MVTSICVPFDAISAVVRQSVIWAGEAGHDVRLFTYRCEFDDIPVTEVTSAAALALDPFFASSDVVIFHLGIYYELFGALLARGPRSALLVRFHNITPRELVPSWDYEVIDKSMAQATLLRFADEVHCDSWFSMQELAERKLEAPLAVRDIAATVSLEPPVTKPGHADGVLRLLFVGRFVRSKGPLELVAAIDEALPGIVHDHVRLDLVGNVGFSDAAYLASVEQAGAVLQRRSGGRFTMQVHGSVPDSERNRLLREADVFVLPTYHEGFCVPVVEALASGCEVVTYDNSNLPDITGGLGSLVPTGDVHALADALQGVAETVAEPTWALQGYRDGLAAKAAYVSRFDAVRVRAEFLDDLGRLGASARSRRGPRPVSRPSA